MDEPRRPFLGHRLTFLIHVIGTALFVCSAIYLGLGIAHNWTSVSEIRIVEPSYVVVSIALYAVSHLSTGLAWPLALRMLGESVSLAEGFKVGLVAQIGKYLPGNVAHYFGRAALAKASGISVKASGLSTAIELASAIIAALLVAPGALVGQHGGLQVFGHVGSFGAIVAVAVMTGVAAAAGWALRRAHRPGLFVLCCSCITVSVLLSGSSAYALLAAMGISDMSWPLVVGAFGLAWIVGFLTPGAPGGLGVRETVFVLLIGPAVGAPAALACAISHRLVTAGVDAVAAIAGYGWYASTRSKR